MGYSRRHRSLYHLHERRLCGDLTAVFQCVKEISKKHQERLFNGVCSGKTRGNSFKLKSRFRLDIRNKFLTQRLVRHQKKIAQRNCGCSIPVGVQGQAGCCFGQSNLVEGVPARCRGVTTRWFFRCLLTQIIL